MHRLILIGASRYFEAMLGPNFREGSNNEDIILPHIDGTTLQLVIDYCYTGRIDINNDNVNSIVCAASSMEFIELETLCCQFLGQNLCTENCIETFLLAEKFSFESLKRKSFLRIVNDFENVPPDEFLRFDVKNLMDLLNYDKIEASEETVFERLRLWMETNTSDSNEKGVELVQCIRMECLSAKVSVRFRFKEHFFD